LRHVDGQAGLGQRKKAHAIQLWHRNHAARSGRPFRGGGDALERGGIAVAFEGPGVNHFAAALDDLAERQVRAARLKAGFFDEFALGGRQGILTRVHAALGNRPRSIIAVRPVRTARVAEQHL